MKSDVLKEVIKKIVQQEVKSILKKELRSCLAEIILSEDSKKTKIKDSSPIKMEEILQESTEQEVDPEPQPKKFVKFIKTVNPRSSLFIYYFTFKLQINLYKDDTDTKNLLISTPRQWRLET